MAREREVEWSVARLKNELAEGGSIDLDAVLVPREIEERWVHLRASKCKPHVMRAIYRVIVLHETWKSAAQVEGATFRIAWGWARKFGLAGRNREQVVKGFARLTELGQDLLEDRLVKQGKSMPTREITKITELSSTALQKSWEQDAAPHGYMSVLDALAKRLREGGTLRLEVTGAPETLDVTPQDSRETR